MSHTTHKREAASVARIRCAVITCSDTRSENEDGSGSLMKERLLEEGHDIVLYRVVPDSPTVICALLSSLVGRVDAVLLNGGTGISRRDSTFEAVSSLLEKHLPGFGELFRMLSYQEIGAAAMLSRATAGIWREMLIFSTPGSPNAVRLALDRLILPELGHLVYEIHKQRSV